MILNKSGLIEIESKGISLPHSPFGDIEYVGTLLFEEYSTTVIYKDAEDNPIVREWADCSDDGQIDRYFYFKTSKFNLLQFIAGSTSNKDFIFSANNNAFYFVDIHAKEQVMSLLIFKDKFPSDYLPVDNYKFNTSDGVDLENIKSYFKLETSDLDKLDLRVIELANKNMFETFNLHLKEGVGVGFGTANTELLGNTLLNFNALYEDATLDYFLGSSRSNTLANQKKQLRHFVSTEVYANFDASYSLLIRPTSAQYDLLDENRSSSEIVAGTIFNLFENAKNIDSLTEKFSDYSPSLIESFKSFLKAIQISKVKLGFGWYNPHSEIIFTEQVDYKVSNNILSNLESLTTQKVETVIKTGLFDVIHCSTSYFGFVSLDNIHYTGYLDGKIKESVRLLNFVDEYEVTIVQKTYDISGRDEPKVENRIISFKLIQNRRSTEILKNE